MKIILKDNHENEFLIEIVNVSDELKVYWGDVDITDSFKEQVNKEYWQEIVSEMSNEDDEDYDYDTWRELKAGGDI